MSIVTSSLNLLCIGVRSERAGQLWMEEHRSVSNWESASVSVIDSFVSLTQSRVTWEESFSEGLPR